MKIINPLYDYAFKYLMQNERIAKRVLSTLLECEIVELFIEQQEVVTVHEVRGLKLYRLDFSALIRHKDGTTQKVLIELQKSKLPTNILRFRTYLGESYSKRAVFVDDSDDLEVEESKAYPIISIYILGYNVVDIPYLSINIDNKITNTVTKEEVKLESEFVDLLTHKMRVIQIRRLPKERRSRLERFLMLFNQAWVTKHKFILDLEEVPKEFEDIVKYLGGPVQDEAFREKLRGEEEIDDIFRRQEAKLAKREEELEKARLREIEAKQRETEAKQREIAAKQQVERERKLKEEAIKKHEVMLRNYATHLLSTGKSVVEVAEMTGLEEDIIRKLA